jgi:hypothetical protein
MLHLSIPEHRRTFERSPSRSVPLIAVLNESGGLISKTIQTLAACLLSVGDVRLARLRTRKVLG